MLDNFCLFCRLFALCLLGLLGLVGAAFVAAHVADTWESDEPAYLYTGFVPECERWQDGEL